MLNGIHSFTPGGNQKRATYAEVCTRVLNSWNSIDLSIIINGFRKPGIWPLAMTLPISSDDEDDGNYSTDSAEFNSDSFDGF